MKRGSPTEERTSQIGDRTGIFRKATPNDLPGIVAIHHEAFRNFFLTKLGSDFLRKYYGLVLTYPAGVILVSERQGRLDGFACGFVNPAEFYHLMWRTGLAFAFPVASALVRHPSLIPRVLYGVQRIQTPASEWPEGACELSSIAVAPESGGNGMGKSLIRAFLAEAWSMGASHVYLTTDAEGNDPVNAFYTDVGFQRTRRFLQREGRWMNEYVIQNAEDSENCEPTLRIDHGASE